MVILPLEEELEKRKNIKIENLNTKAEKENIITWSRAPTIIPTMIGHTIDIHNRREHLHVYIIDLIVGYKFREFSPTIKFQRDAENDNRSRH
ncbi:hypothetical protein N665_0067s0037 [Sinapis alba]|nr:hypothetical protein N665_0067s0037 [Sinapis alba]